MAKRKRIQQAAMDLPRRRSLLFFFVVSLSTTTCALLCSPSSFLGNSVAKRPTKITLPSIDSHNRLHMKVRIGLIGLPNVGKSTLFNALARQSIAQAANFPFCTIEPNVAPVTVPDPYLQRLGQSAMSDKTLNAVMEFVDVAGLVKGASRGEGLGNRFLATIRECHAVCHVIRNFEDPEIVHVAEKGIDPIQDAEVINLELVLADIAHIERRLEKTTCQGDEREALDRLLPQLQKGLPARAVGLSVSEQLAVRSMGLLTLKPVVYVFNVDEIDFLLDKATSEAKAQQMMDQIQYCDTTTDTFAVVSAKLEAQISRLETPAEQIRYLETIIAVEDLPTCDDPSEHDPSLTRIPIAMSYNVLPTTILHILRLFLAYTGPGVPPERSRTTKAHLLSEQKGLTTLQLAGRLHGTIAKGFMRAEVISASKLLEYESYNDAKDAGAIRVEGKDAVVANGDVICIKWK